MRTRVLKGTSSTQAETSRIINATPRATRGKGSLFVSLLVVGRRRQPGGGEPPIDNFYYTV